MRKILILVVCILPVLLLLTIGGITPVAAEETGDPPLQEEKIFDSIEQFNADRTYLNMIVNFTKGHFYRVFFEAYVAYICYGISISITSPQQLFYPVLDYTESINLNYTWNYIDFLAAETGPHNLSIRVVPESAKHLNLWIVLNRTITAYQYFRNNHQMPPENETIYDMCDTIVFNPARWSINYSIPLIKDTEYRFDLVRGSPIPYSYAQAIGFQFPRVVLTLEVRNCRYVLYDNLESLPFMETTDNYTQVRYGSYCTDLGKLELLILGAQLNMNFAFVVYAPKYVGNGPEVVFNYTSPDPNTTNTTTTSTNSTDNNSTDSNDTTNVTVTETENSSNTQTTATNPFVAALGGFQQVVKDTPESIFLFCVILGSGFAIVGGAKYRKDHKQDDKKDNKKAVKVRNELMGGKQ
jgi:hypothetical protein